MTYLKPRKWWMWFGKFMAKCQNKTIQEQYDCGVKWFDLRISFIDEKDIIKPIFSHGFMDYKGIDVEEVLEFLNSKDDVYFRIVLEKGNMTDMFVDHVEYWLSKYPNLKVTQITKKGVWTNLIDPTHELPYNSKDAYASNNGYYPEYQDLPGIFKEKVWSGIIIDDLWPWWYAKLHNEKNLEKYKNEDILLLLDFI